MIADEVAAIAAAVHDLSLEMDLVRCTASPSQGHDMVVTAGRHSRHHVDKSGLVSLHQSRPNYMAGQVMTAGGVGPTPDDVTLKGVAEAFGAKLSRDPTLEHRLRKYFGDHLTTAHLKLAEVPEGGLSLAKSVQMAALLLPCTLPD